MADFKAIVESLSLEEKIALCEGADYWNTKDLSEYGIPSVKMSDGPHGLRCQPKEADIFGINESLPATCFPAAVTAAATFNRELFFEEGYAIGKEAAAAGVSVLLAPGCNIKRNPLGGRNFEYISEDPYLSGTMAAAFVKGVQSAGVCACLKHLAANNQEYKRLNGDSLVDERTLREIYLKPFEIAVKEAAPRAVMCSYNKINGIHSSDNKWLLRDVLRDEWGFEGAVITDWGAMNDRCAAFEAGCDLSMPGGSRYMERAVLDAVAAGELDERYIDEAAERTLRLMACGFKGDKPTVDYPLHHSLARRIAEEGAVLLKNEGNVLPLRGTDAVVVGYMAKHPRYQGSGSSHINPISVVSLTQAMPDIPYICCTDSEGCALEEDIDRAVDAAREGKTVILAIGLPESYESEAFDRDNMRLPDGYIRLTERVSAVSDRVIVLLFGGGAMELPFADKVSAILYMGLAGEAVGEAAASLLRGEVSPSGRLTESWPLSYESVVSRATFGKKNTEYREGIYVGYRYYDKASVPVRYPFGHGLSYSRFEYSDLTVEDGIARVRIRNAGECRASEVVQLYVSADMPKLYRPVRELKDFLKIELDAGEEREIRFELCDSHFAVWNGGFKVPRGNYFIEVGASSKDLRARASVFVDGEEISTPDALRGSFYETLAGMPSREEWEALMGRTIPEAKEARKGEFSMDNSCLEMKDSSLVMKIQYKITERIIKKRLKAGGESSPSAYRMMLTSATDGPMRLTVISSNGMMREHVARGLLHMANGRYIKGIATVLRLGRRRKRKK